MNTAGVSVNRSYDRLAGSYDQQRFSGTAGRFNSRTDARILCELLARTGASVVYDIPVGTGRVAQYCQPMGIRVVGCDLSGDMLKITRDKADRSDLDVALIQADASHLPFASDSIPCVVCLRLLHLFEQPDRSVFIDEFHRIVQPGGYLICSATNALYGLGLNLLRKAIGRLNVSLLWPSQSAELFSRWTTVAVRGNFLPLQRLTALTGSVLEQRVGDWVSKGIGGSLCFERFYLLRKER